MKKSKIKSMKGITLIALVITIIILLILAGIAISQLTGSGLFENVRLAQEKHENAQEYEETQIVKYANEIDSYVSGNRDYEAEITRLKNRITELENLTNYSDKEKVIGTWVDGETLYQKTYTGTTSSTVGANTSVSLGTGIRVIKIDGFIQNSSNNNRMPFNFYYSNTLYIAAYTSQESTLVIETSRTAETSQPFYATIQYTKAPTPEQSSN